MNSPEQFEIPNNMREMAERSIEQARQAYAQFMDVARQANDMMTKSQEAMSAGALDVQKKAMEYADMNMAASFQFAQQLSKAQDMKDALELQQKFASEQMQSYADQSRELAEMMVEVAQKTQVKP